MALPKLRLGNRGKPVGLYECHVFEEAGDRQGRGWHRRGPGLPIIETNRLLDERRPLEVEKGIQKRQLAAGEGWVDSLHGVIVAVGDRSCVTAPK